MGFASRSPDVFVPFVAIVLPAVFLLGVFTAVRLVDSNPESMHCLTGIARIRSYYRTLSPEAAAVGFITTAFINCIVAGVGVALLAGDRLFPGQIVRASLVGALAAMALMAAFLVYQRWRYRVFEPAERHEARQADDNA
jgi:hypothetical protein